MYLLDRIVSFVAPHDCLVCGDEGLLVCDGCRNDAFQPIPERCYHCYSLSADSRTCKKCRVSSRLRHVWVATEYADTAKEVVRRLKFGRTESAAVIIAEHMHDTLPYLGDFGLIIGVPTATGRVRQRGYDQVALIASRLAGLRGIPSPQILVRMGQSRQVGANRAERHKHLAGAYRVVSRHKDFLKGKDVLIVDDVVTTGATLEVAAAALLESGARSVSAAVFAQRTR